MGSGFGAQQPHNLAADVIMACICNRAGECGWCCLLTSRCEMILSSLIDTSHGHCFLASTIVSTVPQMLLLLDSRHRYEMLRKYCVTPDAADNDLSSCHYLSVGCAGAVLSQLDKGLLPLHTDVPYNTLRMTRQRQPSHCLISTNAIISLGLVTSSQNRASCSPGWSLYHTLAGSVRTQQGKLLLRSMLLQPLTDRPTIVERQNAIRELKTHSNLQTSVQQLMTTLPKDIHKSVPPGRASGGKAPSNNTMSRTAASHAIQAVVHLGTVLKKVQSVSGELRGASSLLLSGILAAIEQQELASILELVTAVVDNDCVPTATSKKSEGSSFVTFPLCATIRPGVSKFLDEARMQLTEFTAQLQNQKSLWEADVNGLLQYTQKCGWHLRVHSAGTLDKAQQGSRQKKVRRVSGGAAVGAPATLPDGYWVLQKAKTHSLCTCTELNRWNQRICLKQQDCETLTLQILMGLQINIASHRTAVCTLLDALALLDVLSGFVEYMNSGQHDTQFCCPTLAPRSGTLRIDKGRHPMHGTTMAPSKRIALMTANSCSLSVFSNFNLIFGANRSGKSTYLQQTGLLCVMAQAGLWVPADRMFIHPFGSIVTRMHIHADESTSNSSFMLESQVLSTWPRGSKHITESIAVQDTARMLQDIRANPLALVDELGKATSSTDGLAFAWAVAEQLLACKALTLFASHMKRLEHLKGMYPTVTVWHMGAIDEVKQYRQTHERLSGPCTQAHYGICMAAKAGLPIALINRARQLSCQIQAHEAQEMPNAVVNKQRELLEQLHRMAIYEQTDECKHAREQYDYASQALADVMNHAKELKLRHGAVSADLH